MKIKAKKVIFASELPEDLKFSGIKNRDDYIFIITKEDVDNSVNQNHGIINRYHDMLKERETTTKEWIEETIKSYIERLEHLEKLKQIMIDCDATHIYLDDREPYPDEGFYYRYN